MDYSSLLIFAIFWLDFVKKRNFGYFWIFLDLDWIGFGSGFEKFLDLDLDWIRIFAFGIGMDCFSNPLQESGKSNVNGARGLSAVK